MAEQAEKAWKLLQQEKYDDIGDMLNDAWALKKIASPNATLPAIDALYKKIKKAGAIGAKLLGAGGGGYFLCYVPNQHARFYGVFQQKLLPIRFTNDRSTVVFNDERLTPLR
jgi:D-glycero-alpha-D-manno-heptose-7-phosphate kinase